MRLLIDVGNSRCKYACVNEGAVADAVVHAVRFCDALPTDDVEDGLRRSLREHLRQTPQSVHVVSVAGDECDARVAQAVRAAFADGAPDPVFVAPTLPACGVMTRYRRDQLGADRCLALIAARRRLGRSCIVADCGSAVTLDYLDGDGLHHGGVILPGDGLLRDALRRRTHGLRQVGHSCAEDILAADTDAAIAAGCRRAFCAGIESVIRDMRAQRDGDAPLVLTGGGAAALAAFENCVPAQNLVLEGIAIVAEASGWGGDG